MAQSAPFKAGNAMTSKLLDIDRLSIGLPSHADRPRAVSEVSFSLGEGEILCVVGESGSGKSMIANSIMGLLPRELPVLGGRIDLQGVDLLNQTPAHLRTLRGSRMGIVFQEPMAALNPLMRIGDQIAEVFQVHGMACSHERVTDLLRAVNLPDPEVLVRVYPHMLSGGQRQRVVIAMAIALEPSLLIADEPTTALDVTTQAQILKLIRDIQRRRNTGVLFITHDFGVVREIADRVIVMKDGELVERGSANDVLERPVHDYTKKLLAAVPRPNMDAPRRRADRAILHASGLRKTYWRGSKEVAALNDITSIYGKAKPSGSSAKAALASRPWREPL
jgi:ABC-type glutathione transport system ATPase component